MTAGLTYFRARALEHHERAAAARSPRVAARHRELAAIFESRAEESDLPPTARPK